MVKFEVFNEVILMVTCTGGDQIFTRAGAWIGGDNYGARNFKFTKVMLGPQNNVAQALMGQFVRRMTGENIPLMKVELMGDSVTFYANRQQHVVVYQLAQGESIFVESENILAFSSQCAYDVRFMGQGVISQKGLATTKLTGNGPEAYAAVLVNGNPLVLSNVQTGNTITCDPDAVVCWTNSDPDIKLDVSWQNLIGQHSGESYLFEWDGARRTTVIIQPQERPSGVSVSMD